MIPIIDVVLIIFLSGFVFYGFFFGLIRTIGAIAGVIAGFWLANFYYLQAFSWIKGLFLGYDSFGEVVVFLILFSIANRLVVLAFAVANKAFDFISIIPFLQTINRFAGAIFGLVLGIVLLAFIVRTVDTTPLVGTFSRKLLAPSKVMPYALKSTKFLMPFYPELMSQAKKVMAR